jgi:hypothetical protein
LQSQREPVEHVYGMRASGLDRAFERRLEPLGDPLGGERERIEGGDDPGVAVAARVVVAPATGDESKGQQADENHSHVADPSTLMRTAIV